MVYVAWRVSAMENIGSELGLEWVGVVTDGEKKKRGWGFMQERFLVV